MREREKEIEKKNKREKKTDRRKKKEKGSKRGERRRGERGSGVDKGGMKNDCLEGRPLKNGENLKLWR